jgi:hypothetical protein
MRIISVVPSLEPTSDELRLYRGVFEDEEFGISITRSSYLSLSELLAPGSSEKGAEIVVEYLARRLIASLSMTFSASEGTDCFYLGNEPSNAFDPVASIDLQLVINQTELPFSILLGEKLAFFLDGMWRRHARTQFKSQYKGEQKIGFELAQLAVAPEALADYIRIGSLVDTETQLGSKLLMRLNGKPWRRGILALYKSGIASEVVGEPGPAPQLPTGTSRLSVNIAHKTLSAEEAAEMGQAGAYVGIRDDIASELILSVQDSPVALAEALEFEGRLAYRVIRDLRSSD